MKKVNELNPSVQEGLQWFLLDILEELETYNEDYVMEDNEFEEIIEDVAENGGHPIPAVEAFRNMIGEITGLFSKKQDAGTKINIFQVYFQNKPKALYEALKEIRIT